MSDQTAGHNPARWGTMMSPQLRIKLIFFAQAIAGGVFITRIPDIQTGLGIDATILGLTVVGQTVGALLMQFFASRFIESYGNRIILLLGVPFMTVVIWAAAFAPNAFILFVILAVFAAGFAVTNVAMNVEADRIEAETGTKVMNQCHGIWAFGYLFIGLLGVAMRGWDVAVSWHFFGLIAPSILAAWLIIAPMQEAKPRSHKSADKKRPAFAMPTRATIVLVAFGSAGTLVEMSTRLWSVIFMRDVFQVAAWVDSMTLPIFALLIAVSRMFGDKFLESVGTLRGARTLLSVAILGTVLVAFSPHYSLALLGFGLMGIGICVSFPLMLSAAAQLGDRPASENVAAATFSNTLIMLIAPGAFGLVAGTFGMRFGFWFLVPFLFISLAASGILKKVDQDKAA